MLHVLTASCDDSTCEHNGHAVQDMCSCVPNICKNAGRNVQLVKDRILDIASKDFLVLMDLRYGLGLRTFQNFMKLSCQMVWKLYAGEY